MDLLIDLLKPVTESFFNVTDTMKLCVMRSHDCAVIAKKFLTRIAEVPQWLVVKHARLAMSYMRVTEILSPKHTSLTILSTRGHAAMTSCSHAALAQDIAWLHVYTLSLDLTINLTLELTLNFNVGR